MDLIRELKAILNELDEKEIDYALCGALAMAVYGRPRATLDIDIITARKSLDAIGGLLEELGFIPNSEIMFFSDGDVEIHRFCKPFPREEDMLVLDLLVSTRATMKAFRERLTVKWNKNRLNVVSPKGMILLKSLRNSGQDKDDIAYLKEIDNED